MGAEFLGGISQGLDSVAAQSVNQIQQARKQREQLEAANIANEFESEAAEYLALEENNFDNSFDFNEKAKGWFSGRKEAYLSKIENGRTRRSTEAHILDYENRFNTHVSNFQIEAERGYQKELFRKALSNAVGQINAEPVEGVYFSNVQKIRQMMSGFAPEERALKAELAESFLSRTYFNSISTRYDEQHTQGKLTDKEYLAKGQNIAKLVNSPNYSFTASERGELFGSLSNKYLKVGKSQQALNRSAISKEFNAAYDLYTNNKTENLDPDLMERARNSLKTEQEIESFDFAIEMAPIKKQLNGALSYGKPEEAQSIISELEEERDSYIDSKDYVEAEKLNNLVDSSKKHLTQRSGKIAKNTAEAFKENPEIENFLDAGAVDLAAQKLIELSAGTVSPGHVKFLNNAEEASYANVLMSGNINNIKSAIRGLQQKYDIEVPGLPQGTTLYSNVVNQIAGIEGMPHSVIGVLYYGSNPIYGGEVTNYLLSGAKVADSGLSNKKLNEAIDKKLKDYSKALAKTSDVAFGPENFLSIHRSIIKDLAVGIKVGPGGVDFNVNDVVEKAMEKTLDTRYKATSEYYIPKEYAGGTYETLLGDGAFASKYTDQYMSTHPDFAEKDMLKYQGLLDIPGSETEAKVSRAQILSTGVFRPVDDGSKARLYVQFDQGRYFPWVVNDNRDDPEYLEIDYSKAESGSYDKHSNKKKRMIFGEEITGDI